MAAEPAHPEPVLRTGEATTVRGPHTAKKKKKIYKTINAGEGVERREPPYTVDGNVNWYSHYGEHYEGSLKN